ncbi:MAG TPA: hypothetical protein VGT61_10840 [Thermomicrobiales bacterium]|jgi:hypothetical protein|nr:hypothetical protein [Thermomicrobiales bacterium]
MTRPGHPRPDNLPGGPPTPAPGQPDLVDELTDLVFPVIEEYLQRIGGADEFTTRQFIELMRSEPDGAAVYDEAIRRWGENPRHSRMVIHGQVIPAALRRSKLVEWAGFAHGEPDEDAIPAWWRLTGADTGEDAVEPAGSEPTAQ